MTDSTNLTEDYTRNKIRHTLLPYIQKEFNTSFIKTVTENACLIKDDSDYLDGIAEDFYKHHIRNCAVNIEDLNNTDSAIKRRVLRLMLRDIYNGLNDISSTYVADILSLADKSSGRQINLPYGIVAKNEYGKIILEHKKEETQPFEVSINNLTKKFRYLKRICEINTVQYIFRVTRLIKSLYATGETVINFSLWV